MNQSTKNFRTEFTKAKRLVYERDGYKCMWIGINNRGEHFGGLSCDHIRKRSLRGGNEMTNLITLCIGCHSILDDMPNQKKEALLKNILAEKYGYKYPHAKATI